MKSIFKDDEKGTLIVPPNIHAMMSGVKSAFVAHPKYRLTYQDGTTEECELATSPGDDFFALVSAVQQTSRPKLKLEAEINKAAQTELAALKAERDELRGALQEMIGQYGQEIETGWRKRLHDQARAVLAGHKPDA